jgi:hypothetical protein
LNFDKQILIFGGIANVRKARLKQILSRNPIVKRRFPTMPPDSKLDSIQMQRRFKSKNPKLPCDLIKVDIEGAKIWVLQDYQNLLRHSELLVVENDRSVEVSLCFWR